MPTEPATAVPWNKKKLIFVAGGIAFAAILIGELLWARGNLLRMSKESSLQAKPATGVSVSYPNPTPALKRLPQGRQTFTVSSTDTTKGPQFSEIVVDPYDPRVGAEQAMSIKITDMQPVAKVTVTVATDNGRKNYPMKLASGEATNGVWEAKWKVEDAHDTAYNASFMAQDSKYTDTVTLTIR